MTQPAEPTDAFHAFSAGHAAVLAAFALLTAVACAAGVRGRGSTTLRRAERVAGVLTLAVWITATIYWLHPANFDIEVSLPIHMCDMTGLLAPLVLLTGRRAFRSLLYFWGLGLSIHGILTPILDHGPGHVTFWLYWAMHSSIIGTAIYDVVARRFRPTGRDSLFAIGACVIWMLVVLAVNLSLGVNYGYIGNVTPKRPTVIDQLGPWPGRLFKMIVAVVALFWVMGLMGRIGRRQSQK